MYRGQSIRKEEIIKKLEAQILILWKTDEVRMKKPTVEDEEEMDFIILTLLCLKQFHRCIEI